MCSRMEDLVSESQLDSPSPLLLCQREMGWRKPLNSIRRLSRSTEERRLSRPRILRHVPVAFTQRALVTCMDIDRIESDFLLCGSAKGSIHIQNLANPEKKENQSPAIAQRHQHKKMVNVCQWYSQSIGMFITCSQDNTLKLWDLNAQREVDSFDCSNPCQMHWNEIDGRNPLIAVTNETSHAQLLDLRVGECVQDVRHKKTLTSLRWYPSQMHILATGDQEGTLKLWDIRSGRKCLLSRRLPSPGAVSGIRFTGDGLYMISIDSSSLVHVWDAVSVRHLRAIRMKDDNESLHPSAVRNFSVVQEGRRLRVAIPSSREQVAWLAIDDTVDVETGSVRIDNLSGHFSAVSCCQYRPRQQELYTSSSAMVLCWSSEGERARASLETERSRQKVIRDDWSDED